jgi:hypothetical protein
VKRTRISTSISRNCRNGSLSWIRCRQTERFAEKPTRSPASGAPLNSSGALALECVAESAAARLCSE